MNQLTLARSTDPDTSREAAESVKKFLPSRRMAVLRVLEKYGPMTDVMLLGAYADAVFYDDRLPAQSESGIRSRRAELVRAGYVRDTGERRKLPSGRRGIVWAAV